MSRASLSARRLAGRFGRIGFTLLHVLHDAALRTGCSPPAAPHPVLPRRSSLRSQAGELPPDGDFHPAMWTPSQAHERGLSQAAAVTQARALWNGPEPTPVANPLRSGTLRDPSR